MNPASKSLSGLSSRGEGVVLEKGDEDVVGGRGAVGGSDTNDHLDARERIVRLKLDGGLALRPRDDRPAVYCTYVTAPCLRGHE
jgi:hypothetical protein